MRWTILIYLIKKALLKKMGLKSVIGLGGILPKGEVFAIVMFSRCDMSRLQAVLFRSIALNIEIAALQF